MRTALIETALLVKPDTKAAHPLRFLLRAHSSRTFPDEMRCDAGEGGRVDPAGKVDADGNVSAETESDCFDEVGADGGDHRGFVTSLSRALRWSGRKGTKRDAPCQGSPCPSTA